MASKQSKRNKGITLIKKSNELIEARYKFDIWETRMFLSVLALIHKDDEDFRPYRIWYKDVIKTFGLRSNQSYDLLRNAAKGLMQKVFKVSNLESGFHRETEYHIIRSVNYLAEGEEGKKGVETQEYIDITVDPEMRPLLLQLQRNFTAYDLRNVARLGAYHLRIYELLKQYESIGERTLKFEEMKLMMELVEEYQHFGNFYQRIIDPAVQEINQNTDLLVLEVRKIREGRRYVALHFRFRSKTHEELNLIRGIMRSPGMVKEPTPEEDYGIRDNTSNKDSLFIELSETVVNKWGVSPIAFARLLEEFNEDQIRQAMRVTERAKRQGKADAIAGFFVEAVRKGFFDEEEARLKQSEQKRLRDEALEQLRLTFESNLNKRIRELTSMDERITAQAIATVCQIPRFQEYMIQNEIDATNLDAFRQDETLRTAVKNAIIAAQREHFQDLIVEFEREKAALFLN